MDETGASGAQMPMGECQTHTTWDGVEVAYWLRRPPDGSSRALLLLHGVASNHTRWSELVERTRLTDDWSIVCPDLRGNGDSMSRSGQCVAVWCRDLLEILAAEEFAAAVVVGHSLGAQIAISLAHRAPEAVDGLVLIDPVFPRAFRGRARRWHRLRWLIAAVAWLVGGVNRVGLRRRRFPPRDIRALDEATRRLLRRSESFESIAREYGALRPILRHMPTANYLRQVLATIAPLPPLEEVDVPVLALLSRGVTFAELAVNRQEIGRLPQSEIVILEANHWPLTEAPEATRESIEAWMVKTFPRVA